MLLLCISGQAFNIFLRSSRAQTMKAFIGRLMWFGDLAGMRAGIPSVTTAPPGVLLPEEPGEWLVKADAANNRNI